MPTKEELQLIVRAALQDIEDLGPRPRGVAEQIEKWEARQRFHKGQIANAQAAMDRLPR